MEQHMKVARVALVAMGLLAAAGRAEAKCENLLTGLDGMAGDVLVAQYKKVVSCDSKVANQVFPQFMRSSDEAETLVALSLVAIDADIWNPVWDMISRITSYEARDVVAERVGMSCSTHPNVVGFLEGAYFGLRDIEFSQWDDGLVACDAKEFEDWLVRQVEDPPPKLYDEKWSMLADVLVRRQHAAALGPLAKGASVAAKNGGPFEAILMKMEAAVTPDLGGTMSDEDRNALEKALVGMASSLPPEQARAVADRLANSGSDARAAELLPVVYPTVKKGRYIYGGAAIEAGKCDGQNQAVIHYAQVDEPGKRWIVLPAVEAPLRAAKPKLGKCEVEQPWPVLISPEPLAGGSQVGAWVETLVQEWEKKGFEVKTKEEKTISLP